MKDEIKLNPLIVGGNDVEKIEAMIKLLDDESISCEWKVITLSRELKRLLNEK